MIRTVLLTSLFALASPALAQDSQTPPAQTPPAEAPATEPPASEAATPPASDPSAASPSARPATAEEVGTLVASEFPRRDLDSNGSLNQEEFGAWLGELLSRSPGGGSDAQARIGSAFSQADADGSGSVSPAEMITLLSRQHQ